MTEESGHFAYIGDNRNDKSILVETFVYVLLSNVFFFGQTIDVSRIKL